MHRLFPGLGDRNGSNSAAAKHASESPKPAHTTFASEDDADGWVVLGDAREAQVPTTDTVRRRSYADVVAGRS